MNKKERQTRDVSIFLDLETGSVGVNFSNNDKINSLSSGSVQGHSEPLFKGK